MGNRANFVIVENGKATAYADEKLAYVAALLVDDGPKATKNLLGIFEPTTKLFDWATAEGGFLLDLDEKRLLVFGQPGRSFEAFRGKDREGLERAREAFGRGWTSYVVEHLAPKWRGWTIVWDERGVDAFADHLASRRIKTIKTARKSAPPTTPPAMVVTVVADVSRAKTDAPKKKAKAKAKAKKATTPKAQTKAATPKKKAKATNRKAVGVKYSDDASSNTTTKKKMKTFTRVYRH